MYCVAWHDTAGRRDMRRGGGSGGMGCPGLRAREVQRRWGIRESERVWWWCGGPGQLPPEEQVVTAHPDVQRYARTPHDEFLVIACDG
eukprot:2719542-Rhodomonas_salina.2